MMSMAPAAFLAEIIRRGFFGTLHIEHGKSPDQVRAAARHIRKILAER